MKRERNLFYRLSSLLLCVWMGTFSVSASECSHEYVRIEVEATCVDAGMTYQECVYCGDTRDYQSTPALGHAFGEWYILLEPTCTREGIRARDCVRCDVRQEEPIPHLGHEYVVEVVPPTCTARGYTAHYCPGCGDRFRTDYTEPTGHHYDDGVVIREPTLTAMGRMLFTCLGCGDTYQETIPVLSDPFIDLDEKAYYYEPVLWAVYRGITTGVDGIHFAPDQVCTRGQVVTFLWRSVGCPAPETGGQPFDDVAEDAYYRDAVCWAYQSGITTGTDAFHFSPEETCTRAQVVTFLHRLHGCPATDVSIQFPDVYPTDYYAEAVRWAAGQRITLGMEDGCFHPHDLCTRAQIVTFLYRDIKQD